MYKIRKLLIYNYVKVLVRMKSYTLYIYIYIKKRWGTRRFYFIQIVRGGVQMGPLCTLATNWPAQDDYDGEFGEMIIGRGN
jgi:hypothetical protein